MDAIELIPVVTEFDGLTVTEFVSWFDSDDLGSAFYVDAE